MKAIKNFFIKAVKAYFNASANNPYLMCTGQIWPDPRYIEMIESNRKTA